MNKTILISIIVVIAIVAVVLVAKPFSRKEKPVSPVKQAQIPAKEDSVASINQALEATETIDLNKEFEAIDADLQSL